MATQSKLPFSWRDVDQLPDLRRLELALEHLPDGPVVAALSERRGRDDYPVEAMWRALVAGVVFQHASVESLLRELRRNPALLDLCGFDPLPRRGPPKRSVGRSRSGGAMAVSLPSPARDGVPGSWAFSRFLAGVTRLEDETAAVSGMAAALRRRRMEALPRFGRHLGYDGKAVDSHSTGREDAKSGETSDPDADWGKHETHGVDRRAGKAWTKVKTWFGYGLHLIADVEHEIPVWFEVTEASRSEHKALSAALDELFADEPELAARCEDFGADRGLDGGPLKTELWDVHAARPLIDVREMWREEKRCRAATRRSRSCARSRRTAAATCCTARRARCSAAARRRGRSGRWRSRASRRCSATIWMRRRVASFKNVPEFSDRCLTKMFLSRS